MIKVGTAPSSRQSCQISGTPDRFTFSILDQNGNPIPTTDNANNDMEYALLGVDITNSPTTTFSNIETYPDESGAITVSVMQLGSPPSVAPEPATLGPLCLGIGGALGGYALCHRRTSGSMGLLDPGRARQRRAFVKKPGFAAGNWPRCSAATQFIG